MHYYFMDLDGTVTDSKEGITKSVAYALRRFGISVDNLDALEVFIGPPLADSFREYYGFDEEQAAAAVEAYREYFSTQGIFENVLYDGMRELLEHVTERGAKVVLATSKPEPFAKQILQYFDLLKYFSFVAGSTLDGKRSRKGDVIRYALEALGIAPQEAVMIGDRKHDVIGAKENKMKSVGVLYGYGDRAELEAAGADWLAEDVRGLEALLHSLAK